jgi:hypothetical protein
MSENQPFKTNKTKNEYKITLLVIILWNRKHNVCSKLSKDTLRINYDYSYQVNKEDTLSKKREQMVLMLQKFFFLYVSLNNMKLNDLAKNWKESDGLPDRKSLPKTKLHYTIVKSMVQIKRLLLIDLDKVLIHTIKKFR